MDDIMLACSDSDECEDQVTIEMETLPNVCNQISEKFDSTLSDTSILMLRNQLQLMQRGSYYLVIQRDDWPRAADQQLQSLHLSDSELSSFIDHRRLQCTKTQVYTHVKLRLAFLEMLYQEIFRSCQELKAFTDKYDQGLVESDMAASMQQKLQQTHQYVNEFQSRLTCNLVSLNLQSQIIPKILGNFSTPTLTMSLVFKLPVIFNRCQTYVTSNAVHLCWEVAGQLSNEPDQEFEINIKSLHPSTAEHDQFTKITCQSYNRNINNLTPDRFYQVSVKRVDDVDLVYGHWIDTITLKTLDIKKD